MNPTSPFRYDDRYQLSLPRGLPTGQSVCIASSRLGQKLENHDRWFDALRTLATRLSPEESFFITSAGTTADGFVRRVADLFGFTLIEFTVQPSVTVHPNDSRKHPPVFSVHCQPIDPVSPFSIDDVLISVASQVHLLSVRRNGNIHRAALSRLQKRLNPAEIDQPSKTNLLVENSLTKPSLARELIDAGAVGWWLFDRLDDAIDSDAISRTRPFSSEQRPNTAASCAPILSWSAIQSEQFLLHWTRRRVGPWPDQTEHQFLDDLIFQTNRRQHDAHFSLAQILATRRIVATHELTRGNQPVVCFTNRSLGELPANKIFRQHLGRWDFLPFGIAVDRQTLADRGARPVIYGDETTWASMPEVDRPFYQSATSKNGNIDWTIEDEWRLAGDLNLNQLPIDAVFVFVETESDAHRIALLSRWPVVYLK